MKHDRTRETTRTVNDLLFPNPVLEVDKTVRLDSVAEPHQVFAHLFQCVLLDEVRRVLARFHQFSLALEQRQPGVVEVVP
jgi:hypothetical protein